MLSAYITVYRKISQTESTKQGIATVAYVTYGNLMYTALRQKCDSSTAMSYQYYDMDAKAGVTKNDMHKLDVFQTKCQWRICNIFWPNKISNEDLYRRTHSLPISYQIQKHRMRWLGHVLRMSPDHIPSVAPRWTHT